MSMLSSQIDALREASRTYQRMGNRSASNMLKDAVDTIWQLRDDLQQANAENAKLRHDLEEANNQAEEVCIENAKLREERDMYCALVDCMVHPDIPDQLAAENAKLRELCSDMLMCLTWQIEPHSYMMDGCDHCQYRGKTNGMCGLGMFRGRARELGVEVDDGN